MANILERKPAVQETWLVVREVDGVVRLDPADSKRDAIEAAEAALRPLLHARGGTIPPPAAASGVVELNHSLRAARVHSFRRLGQKMPVVASSASAEDLPPAVPAAYDVLCPFGVDLARDLAEGRQPPADRVFGFLQKLGLPVVTKRPELAPRISEAVRNDRARRRLMIALIVLLLMFLIAVIGIFRNLH